MKFKTLQFGTLIAAKPQASAQFATIPHGWVSV